MKNTKPNKCDAASARKNAMAVLQKSETINRYVSELENNIKTLAKFGKLQYSTKYTKLTFEERMYIEQYFSNNGFNINVYRQSSDDDFYTVEITW